MPKIRNPITEWVRGTEIGKGKFATVYMGINKENMKLFAIKSVDKDNKERKAALANEKRALKHCNSKYVVQYFGCAASKIRDPPITALDLFIELVPKGSVLDQLTRTGGGLSENLIAAYTRDVLQGLTYIHNRGIVHGDIKCANFLVGSENIKLGDFGSAKFMDDDDVIIPHGPVGSSSDRRRIKVTGTDGWKAPEVLDEFEQERPSDIYSLGCSIVEMCTGIPPLKEPAIYVFEGFDPEKDEDDEFGFSQCAVDIPPTYSDLCREFVDWCFALNPEDRPSAIALLDHPWIVNAPPYPEQTSGASSARTRPTRSFLSLLGCGPSKN